MSLLASQSIRSVGEKKKKAPANNSDYALSLRRKKEHKAKKVHGTATGGAAYETIHNNNKERKDKKNEGLLFCKPFSFVFPVARAPLFSIGCARPGHPFFVDRRGQPDFWSRLWHRRPLLCACECPNLAAKEQASPRLCAHPLLFSIAALFFEPTRGLSPSSFLFSRVALHRRVKKIPCWLRRQRHPPTRMCN